MFLLIFKSAGYIHMDHRIIWFNQHTCGLLSSADRIFARFATAVSWSDPPLERGDSHDTSRVSIKSCFTLFSSSLLPKLLLSQLGRSRSLGRRLEESEYLCWEEDWRRGEWNSSWWKHLSLMFNNSKINVSIFHFLSSTPCGTSAYP